MAKTHAEIRFDKARKRLSSSLKNLEEVVKAKLHEVATNCALIEGSEDEAKVAEQANTIQNLNHEINNLQQTLCNLGKETEFLKEQNKNLANKITDFRNKGLSLVESIEADLIKIEEVIKNHDN